MNFNLRTPTEPFEMNHFTNPVNDGDATNRGPFPPQRLSFKSKSKNTSAIMREKNRKKHSPQRKCLETFKMIDKFGQTVNLTWNGEDEFKTTFGASVTFVLIVILIFYTIFKFNALLTFSNPQFTKKT
jgi:hypothetical protein